MNANRHKLITVTLAAIAYLLAQSVLAADFHIAPHGSDANPGTADKPFATAEHARDAIRHLKSQGDSGRPVNVIFRKGVYALDQPLVLEAEDSGTSGVPIVWRAAAGEKVVLSGGRTIRGRWRSEDGQIWYVDVPGTRHSWNFRQLFVHGKRAIRARHPNRSEANPFLYATGGGMDHIRLGPDQVKMSWGQATDAQVNIVANWRFFNQWNDVVGVDPAESIIHIGPRERHGKIIKGNWFWIEGVRSELDSEDEWFLDRDQGRLYYMPPAGKNPNDMEIVAPYLNRIVYLKGDVEKATHVEYVNFTGLQFRHTTFTLGHIEARVHTDSAVMMENASHCRIERCHFENIGGYAVWLHLDSRNNVLHRNTVLNSGGGGVLMTGSRLSYMDDSKIYTPGHAAGKVAPILNEVTHNTVKHCGKIRSYGGGVHLDSRPKSMAMMPGNYIAHNHFQDLSRNGIFVFRNQGGNVVEYNHIHDCMQTTIDGACIHFASMNRLTAGNYILNNYLYDIWGFEQKTDGQPRRHLANGVFLDWATSNTTVKDNYIYNAGGQEIKAIMGNWGLSIEGNHTSKRRIEPPFLKELGPGGTASCNIRPAQLGRTGRVIHYTDKDLVTVKGNWKREQAAGLGGLFRFSFLEASAEAPAETTFNLPISEPGTYRVCLLYLPRDKNASNAGIRIVHAEGQETRTWNMKKGDQYGFAIEIGKYRFDPDTPAMVTISNIHANGAIVADSVALVKTSD